MTKDIWAEKPEPVWVPGGYSSKSKIKEDDVQMIILDDLDAFHEKLKSSFDESITDCHHSLELVAKNLGKYMEKAEKWNELCDGLEYGGNTPVENILQEINLIDRDNELRRKKLGAVKTWAEKEISENSRIADAKYEEVMEGRDEAPDLNYHSGKRDQAKELLMILEVGE